MADITRTFRVVLMTPGAKSAEMGGVGSFSLAPDHSSGSGTAFRIQIVANAGSTPTRKTIRGSWISLLASEAISIPAMYPLCKIAPPRYRCFLFSVSDTNAAPAAHSPPMPRAARNRKMRRCHHSVDRAERPVKHA